MGVPLRLRSRVSAVPPHPDLADLADLGVGFGCVQPPLRGLAQPDILAHDSNGGLSGLATGHQAFDDQPELGGVVRLSEVGEFVD